MVHLIVDGNSLWARSYFAALKNSPEDLEEAAIKGIYYGVRTLYSLISPSGTKLSDTPTHLLVAWDGDAKMDKGRAEKPKEYIAGLSLFADVLKECFNAANAYPEKEADDAVATAARQALEGGSNVVYVASGDKDLQQLSSDRILYWSLNEKSVLNRTYITTTWNVKNPEQVAIALAILGDQVDRIQGIKGWGPKKVAKIFDEVSEDDSFESVVDLVRSKMNQEQVQIFDECLALTKLNSYVQGIPPANEIKLASREVLESYELHWLANFSDMGSGRVNVDDI